MCSYDRSLVSACHGVLLNRDTYSTGTWYMMFSFFVSGIWFGVCRLLASPTLCGGGQLGSYGDILTGFLLTCRHACVGGHLGISSWASFRHVGFFTYLSPLHLIIKLPYPTLQDLLFLRSRHQMSNRMLLLSSLSYSSPFPPSLRPFLKTPSPATRRYNVTYRSDI